MPEPLVALFPQPIIYIPCPNPKQQIAIDCYRLLLKSRHMAHGFRTCLALYIVFKSSGCSSGAFGLRVLKSGGKTSTSKSSNAEMHKKLFETIKKCLKTPTTNQSRDVARSTKKVCRSFYLLSLVMGFVNMCRRSVANKKNNIWGEYVFPLIFVFHCISQMHSNSVLMYL